MMMTVFIGGQSRTKTSNKNNGKIHRGTKRKNNSLYITKAQREREREKKMKE